MNLGMLYSHGGDGIPLDYVKAVESFRKAADQNDAYAQYNLGWAYESGLGVPKDRRESIVWYRKAAGNGNLLALRRLDRLSESGGTWSALVHLLGF